VVVEYLVKIPYNIYVKRREAERADLKSVVAFTDSVRWPSTNTTRQMTELSSYNKITEDVNICPEVGLKGAKTKVLS